MKKKIKEILSRPSHWHMVGDGFRVYNYFPSGYPISDHMNPFLMLDFNPEFYFEPSTSPRGVGVHPHKGFETVTIAYQGVVAHHDSAGHSGIIRPGEVQWMTAGSGILHKEYHEAEFSKSGGAFEMIQLWVNLPKAFKNLKPDYQAITLENRCVWFSQKSSSYVHVIAGSFNKLTAKTRTCSVMDVWDLHIIKDTLSFKVPEGRHSSCLVVKGHPEINGSKLKPQDFVLFEHSGVDLEIFSESESIVLWLSGEPINEPVVQYGPFVMNTRQEINEAMEAFHSGAFGYLED